MANSSIAYPAGMNKNVSFPYPSSHSETTPTQTQTDDSPTQAKKRKSKRHTQGLADLNLEDIRSDKSDAPRKLKMGEVCIPKQDDMSAAANTADDYMKQRSQENQEFEANALSSVESLAPFKLKWVYGRTPNVNVINLTGLYKNHIAYASSNVVIIYDYVKNEQKCLQGHKNAITSLTMDKKCRFLASSDAGYKSLIIVWDTLAGKALKFFPEPHDGKGCSYVTFTGLDFVLATIGNEEPSRQTICLWDFHPNHRQKTPFVIGHLPPTPERSRELDFDPLHPEFFSATGDKSVVFCTWVRNEEDNQNQGEINPRNHSISCYKPKTKNLVKFKSFTNSLWLKDGKWLATATMSGFLLVWTPPIVLGLEDPPDPKKNIRELKRYYKISEFGITYFTTYRDFVVAGDEKGVIRFYDQDLKLVRWTKSFYVKPVKFISFNLTEELPQFKRLLRQKFDYHSKNYLHREEQSRVRDYSLGGTKDRDLSMTTINRPPMTCTDFIFSVEGGDVYYYHFKQSKVDLLVNGTPGKFVTCDVSPGSNNIIFCTRKGEIQVYDFVTHKLVFADQIFTGSHRVSTMKFHPTGFFVCFGLIDGHLTFRRSFSWRTLIPPIGLTPSPIIRIVFSDDGLMLSFFTTTRIVALLKYLPKAKSWVSLGKCRTHQLDICDVQFFHDPKTKKNRLFSLGLDRYLVEYDIENCNVGDPRGLRVLKIMRLEETCQPTAMVFDGPPEFGADCITFSNTLNKLRLFHYKQERVRRTVSGPVFGRDHAINRMIEFPAQMSSTRFKKFIIFVRGNKLGIIDTPLDGNPHKYVAVVTHPGPITDIATLSEKGQIFTIGHMDNAALQWEACVRSVEATVIMGGSGITPFYHNLRRNWGGACQDVVKDIDLIFFFMNLKRVDSQTEIFNITRTIRISEIPAVCRACGFYPSEYEVDLMIDEARRIKMLDQHYTDDYTTEFSFEDFIKLFSNHYYRITEAEVEDAFRFLGFEEREEPYICRSDFVYYLTNEGEKLNPYDFPIHFESMYLSQSLTVFSNVHCHVKPPVDSSESESGASERKRNSQMDFHDNTSMSSSSSSTRTADISSSGSDQGDQGDSDEAKEGDGEENEEDDDDDDDDDDMEAKAEKMNKKKKEEQRKRSEQEEEPDDEEEGEEDEYEVGADGQRRKTMGSDKRKSRESGETEQEGDEKADTDELMDLPERIDLSFFLTRMLPPDCQQTIRWRPELQKKSRDLTLRPDVMQKKKNQEYYETLMKEVIDPNFPIHKKLLNTLYAEYFMEHGDFAVPEELQYPGYGPQDSWFADEGEEEEPKGGDESSTSSPSPQTSAPDVGEDEDHEGGILKKRKSKQQADEEEEEDEDEEEDEEGEGEGQEDGEAEERYDGEEDIAAAIFQSYRSDEYEYGGEFGGEDTSYYNETEEGDESGFSAPFSISETMRQSMDESGQQGTNKSGITPGYNSDNTEYTDIENAYEEEDVAFIKEVNETFRPPPNTAGTQDEPDGGAADDAATNDN